jgi:hypothetical protein
MMTSFSSSMGIKYGYLPLMDVLQNMKRMVSGEKSDEKKCKKKGPEPDNSSLEYIYSEI